MLNKLKHIIITATIAILASSASAATKPIAFKILPVDSHIKFQATQGGSPINGEFKTFVADIDFHPDALGESKVKVTINTGSYIVDDADAKGALKDAEWFNVALFPDAVFEAKSFKSLGEKRYEAIGSLTIKGHSEPTILTFTLNEFSKEKAAVTGEVVLKRRAFNIGETSTDSIKDDVHVYIDIKAAAASK